MSEETLVLDERALRRPALTGVGPAALLLEPVALGPAGPADPIGPARTEGLVEHRARLGPRPAGSEALVELAEAARLTGHGGAYMSAAVKWRSVQQGNGQLTIVANGAESEPLSGKDGTVLRQRPHLVLDGLELLAESLGAARAVLWLHGDDRGARIAVKRAIAERPASGSAPHVEVVTGPVHYLSGESSAILRALAGGPALPTLRRRVPLGSRPRTLVQNVETLARLALVARGLGATPTRLLTVLGMSRAAGRAVVEVPLTATLADVLRMLGERGTPQAALLGGFGGAWASWAEIADVAVEEATMRAAGHRLGAGVVAPIDAATCGVRQTAAVAGYLARMSAKQCGPCLFGLPALTEGLEALAAGRGGQRGVARLLEDAATIEGRGACHHPDGATGLVASALAAFSQDVQAHADGYPCPGGISLPGIEG